MRMLGLLCVTLGASWSTTTWAAESVSTESPVAVSSVGTALALTSLRTAQAQPVEVQRPTSSPAPGGTTPATPPQPTSSPAPGATTTPATAPEPATPPQPTSSKAPPSTMQPTSSKAPPSTTDVATPEPEEDDLEPVDEEEDDDLSLEDERGDAVMNEAFHRHGIGAHGGIVVIPTWLLSSWLASHTNALCRGTNIGNFALDRGLSQQDGCNFYAGADYVFRFSRVLDIAASVQYQRAKVPDGLWLDKAKFDGSPASLEAADYTEVDLGLIAMEVDFIARAPLVVNENVEFGLGGGAGLGLGVVLGDVHQTPLGAAPQGFTPGGGVTTDTCQDLSDLSDLTRCTPRWDANEDGDMVPPDPSDLSSPNPDLFAQCTTSECNENDLRNFGYRLKQGGIPPVIPVVNLIISARIIIKDAFGITINGGFNTGFYFGGGMQYFFGKPSQDEMSTTPTVSGRPRRALRSSWL